MDKSLDAVNHGVLCVRRTAPLGRFAHRIAHRVDASRLS
jgi:hypothetical protein